MSLATLNEWRLGGQRFEYKGHDIFWREAGAGPALLLIHGFPTSSWDWRGVWARLASHHRVIAPDMLGFGFSAKPRGHDYRIGEQASMITQLMAACHVQRCHVLAHDYGDSVAQELLARHSEDQLGFRIRSVSLLNGGLFPESYRPLPIQRLLMSPLGPLAARLLNRGALARSMRRIFAPDHPPGEDEIDGFWELIETNDGRSAIARIMHYHSERVKYRARWVGALRCENVPIRFINGMEDPISGAHIVTRYRELVPNPDVVELHGVGHYPQIEDPEAVLSAVLAFLAGRVAEREAL